MTYEAMEEPKLVMACGACAASGGTYGSTYAIVGALDKVLPVDIAVPGCPPRPSAMLIALTADYSKHPFQNRRHYSCRHPNAVHAVNAPAWP
jgi:NADH:ubiquinone oxidoreductase subunit B-like Fe-S oxidoreductase